LIRSKSTEIKIFTQFPLFIHREIDAIQIQCPYGCYSIDRFAENLDISDNTVDNYVQYLDSSKILVTTSLPDYCQIITEIKKGENFDMLKVIFGDFNTVCCIKKLQLQSNNALQSIILNNAGKISRLHSHYSEELIKILYIELSNEFYYLTNYCPYSLKAISQKQYYLSPNIFNCIFYQILLCFQTILSKGYLPFPLQLKHLLLNTKSIINLTNLQNLIKIDQISNLNVSEHSIVEYLVNAPPEIFFKDVVNPEKASIWIAGILIAEYLLQRPILEPTLYTNFGIYEQLFSVFGGPSDLLVKRWSKSTSPLFLKQQSSKKSKINDILQNNIAPTFHYLIDTIQQMTMVDKEMRPTIKKLLKTEIMKTAKKEISLFAVHLPECPHQERNERKPLFGTIHIQNNESNS
jgi:hypothetical protein